MKRWPNSRTIRVSQTPLLVVTDAKLRRRSCTPVSGMDAQRLHSGLRGGDRKRRWTTSMRPAVERNRANALDRLLLNAEVII